jgi:DNA ligase-1
MKMTSLPLLYKEDAKGNRIEWKIWTIENKVYVSYGIVGGKMRDPVSRTIEGTRKGQSNERSAEQQAKFHADSKWRQQLVKGYRPSDDDKKGMKLYNEIMKESSLNNNSMRKEFGDKNKEKSNNDKRIIDTVNRNTKIMKCHKFQDHKSKIKWEDKPYAQAKYDGTRCLACARTMTTSSGKQFVFLKHIKDALAQVLVGEFANVILDGECYVHSLPNIEPEHRFNEITGACRSVRSTPHPLELKMQLHVFDIVDFELNQEERFEKLDRLFKTIPSSLPLIKAKRWILKSEQQLYTLHDRLSVDDYEGVIVRNRYGKYVTRRNFDIQKYKEFHDEECRIIGAKQSEGTEEGCVIWLCEYPANKETFECRPRGTIVKRQELYNERDKHIGKADLTVRYQALTNPVHQKGVPRFPVGISIRDYE